MALHYAGYGYQQLRSFRGANTPKLSMSPPPVGFSWRARPASGTPLTCSFAIGPRVTHRVYWRNLSGLLGFPWVQLT
jgi:hypothetical protein